jgi:GNAT superfamily N-acetyltransferase
VIRPLEDADTPALAEALAAMDPWARLGFSAKGLAAYLTRPDPALRRMVLLRDGQPAGVVALRAPWLRGPFIELLAILPGHQGAGLGRAAIQWAVEQAGGNLWVTVSAFNESARAFYAATGFQEVASLPDLVAEGFEEVLMRRRG